MSHDHDELATRFAYIEDRKNVTDDHLKHLHAAVNEAMVIVAGGEVPSDEKLDAIVDRSRQAMHSVSAVIGMTNTVREDFHHPTPEDIEHDIAEQRWEENRDLSAVDR